MKKTILIILIICWMATVFTFSNQISDKSSNTSGKTIRFIIDKLQITKNMDEQEINNLIENLQNPIRKLAHFSLYALGGILSYLLFNQYNIQNKRKVIFSLMLCVLYAITDEFHQYFVPGRSCELRDILIDSCGALLGICISYFVIYLKNRCKHVGVSPKSTRNKIKKFLKF